MKFQDDISIRNIIVAKCQFPKFTKREKPKKLSNDFFFNVSLNILFNVPYQLTQVLSF